MNKKVQKIGFLFLLSLFLSTTGFAADISSAQTGNWSLTSTWVGGIVPSASDNVTILNSHVVTLNGDYTVTNMTINSGGEFINSTNQLYVGSQLTVNGTFTPSTGTLKIGNEFAGTATISMDTDVSIYHLKVEYDLNINGVTSARTLNIDNLFSVMGNYAITKNANLTVSYQSTAKLKYNGSTTVSDEWPTTSGVPFIELSVGIATISDGNTYPVNDKLTLNGGTISITSGALSYITASLEYTVSSNTNQGAEWPSSGNVPESVIMNSSGYTITMQGARTVAKDLTMTSGTLDINSNNLSVLGTIAGSDVGGGGTVSNTGGTGVITIGNGSTAQVAQKITGNLTLDNLTINKNYVSAATDNDLTISGSPTVTNNVTLTAGDLILDGTGASLTISSGSFTQSAGTTTITNGTFTVTSGNLTVSSGTFTNNKAVTISNTANKIAVAAGATFVTGSGATSIDVDEIELTGTGTYKSGRAITNLTTLTLSATSTFEITADQSLPNISASYGDLTISNGAFVSASQGFTLQSGTTLLVTGNSSFDLSDYAITKSGLNTLQIDAGSTLLTGTTDITGFASGYTLNGNVNYDGITSQNLINATYNNLTLNTSTGKPVVNGSSTKVTGTLTFSSGVIDAMSNALTLGVSATANSTNNSFIEGSVIRETNGIIMAFSFPVANGSNERGVTITFTTAPATSNTITVSANGTLTSPTSSLTDVKSVESDGFWTITTSLGTLPSGYTLSLNTDGFSPIISGLSNVTIVRGLSQPTFNAEKGLSENSGINNVSAVFSDTDFGDFAIANLVGTFTWDGSADNNWSTDANWVGGVEPQTGDNIEFDHTALDGAYSVVFDGASTVATNFTSITINSDGGTGAIDLTFSTGIINLSGTNLTVETGHTIVFNGSTVSGYNSGNTDYPSGSTVDYRTGTVNSDVYEGDLIINNLGSIFSNGDIIVSGAFTKSSSGTVTFSSNQLSVTGTSTINAGVVASGGSGNFVLGTVSNSGTLNIGGTAASSFGAYSGSGTILAAGSGAITFSSIYSPTGNTTFNTQDLLFQGNITLVTGGTFTPSTNTSFTGTTLTVNSGGSISNSTGSIAFEGSGAQNLANGSGTVEFNDLVIDNSNGVTLNDPASVNGTLSMTSGNLTTTATNIITVNSTVSGGSNSSYINGSAKIVNTESNTTVPVGNGGRMRAIGILPPDSGAIHEVQFFNTASSNGTSTVLDHVSTKYYWEVTKSGVGGNSRVTLHWGPNGQSEDGVNDYTALRVARWVTDTWTDRGGTTNGTNDAGSVLSWNTTLVGTQEWTLGSSSSDNSLPVELTSFAAQNGVEGVKLTWSVESEIDNQAFIIDRRLKDSGDYFESITEIEGRGTASSAMDYDFLDRNVLNIKVYEYRLRSRDYSGLVHVYENSIVEIAVELVPDGFALEQNYPNPFNPTTTIRFSLSQPAKVLLSIYDITGKEVQRLVNNENLVTNNYDYTWNAKDRSGRQVASGVYFYRMVVNSGQHILTKKMILVK